MPNKLNYKLINILLSILIVCLLYSIKGLWLFILLKLCKVFFPFFIAFSIAYALYPNTKKIEKIGIPKWASIGIIYSILLSILIIICIRVIPLFYEQVILFLSNISVVITDISSKFKIDLRILQNYLSETSGMILKNIGIFISDGAINILNASINMVTNLIVILSSSIYFLWDMDKIRNNLKYNLKTKKKRIYKYALVLDSEINNYFNGLFKTIFIQFIEYTLAFFLIGHPNYLILGLLAAITTIIPYFGALIVNVLAIIIASIISKELLILTIIVCIICPNIDGYIIGPKIYGKTNKLPPLVNIFAVFTGGILLGFWGIVLSLPVAIIIMATYKFFKTDIDKGIINIKERI